MTAKTHLMGGALSALVAIGYSRIPAAQAATGLLVAAFGSLFPDIDCRNSMLGRLTRPVSTLIGQLFGHRTLFHSPLLYAALFLLFSQNKSHNIYGHLFIIGAVSHLFLDMFNSKGIPLFYPCRKRFRLGHIKERSIGERAVYFLLFTLCVLTILYFIRIGRRPFAF